MRSMLSTDQNGKSSAPTTISSTHKYETKFSTSNMPKVSSNTNIQNGTTSSSSTTMPSSNSSRSNPTTIKIKREDLSPVSRFREEQKLYTPDSAYKSASSTTSSSTFQNPTTNYYQQSFSRQDTPTNLYSPSLSSYSSASRSTRAPSYTKSQYGSTATGGYKQRTEPSPSSSSSLTSKYYTTPSSKYETSFTSYDRSAAANRPIRSTTKFRIEYSDSDDDKIC